MTRAHDTRQQNGQHLFSLNRVGAFIFRFRSNFGRLRVVPEQLAAARARRTTWPTPAGGARIYAIFA
jgi:hypothetical protein